MVSLAILQYTLHVLTILIRLTFTTFVNSLQRFFFARKSINNKMATSMLNAQKKQDDFKKKFLICSICSDPYDNDDHQAKCLPCLHSYCRSCLQSHAGKQPTFNCPNCNSLVSPRHGTIDSLPDNHVVENLKAYHEILIQSVCGSCDDSVNQVKSLCHDCSCFLCEVCVNQHKRMRALKNHKLSTMAELQEKRYNPLRQQQLRCTKHPKQELSMYCKGADCKVVICASGLVNHAGHELIELTTAMDEIVERVGRQSSKVQERNDELKLSHEAVDNKKKSLSDRYNQREKDIQDAVRKIHGLIDSRHEKACSHLKHLYDTEMKRLTGNNESIDFLADQMNSACDFASEACDISSPTQLLDLQNQILHRLHELEITELPKSASDKTDLHFTDKHHTVLVQIQESLQHLCDVDWLSQPQTYKPSKVNQSELKSGSALVTPALVTPALATPALATPVLATPALVGNNRPPTSALRLNGGNQTVNSQVNKVTPQAYMGNPQAHRSNPQTYTVNHQARQVNPQQARQVNPQQARQVNPQRARQVINPQQARQVNPQQARQVNFKEIHQVNSQQARQGNPPQANKVNPSRCKIQLRQPGDTAGLYNATIQTVGHYGQMLPSGGAKVEVTQDRNPLPVQDNKNGTYTFRYSLLLGNIIQVKINGLPMYGSPFSG